MSSTLAYLPFRVVGAPTARLGCIVAWLAEGYRTAAPLERALIFPTWALLRGLFIVGYVLARTLYVSARTSLDR